MAAGFPAEADLVADALACRRGDRLVFANLSCRIPAGGALFLTGSNGSGKSSLLRVLATLLTPAAGEVLWGDARVSDDLPAYRAAIHYVGHLDGLKLALTARETLAFWAAQRANPAPQVDAALAAVGLEHAADWPCRWLSAGQRKRLALARLLAAPTPVWLLDEPSAALDRDGDERLAAIIAAHRAEGGRAIIATHTPLDVPGPETLALDDFAPEPIDFAADDWADSV
jgi:heme exporter protein A